MNLISKILSNSLKLGDENKFNFAFDFRELLNDGETEILDHLSLLLWNKIKHLEPEVLVTKGYGGTPLLFGIKLAAYQDGHNLSTLQIRETRKTRGEFKKLVEGPVPEKLKGKRKTIFVDDLIQNGKTFHQVEEILFDEGYDLDIIGIAVILDLWGYSRQFTVKGFNLFSLYRRHDLGLTRQDHGIPSILDNPNWQLHVHHTGRDYMPVKSWPVIHDGKIFVGNDNTTFYCYDVENGDLIWKIDSDLPSLKGTVCVAQFADENVYYTSYDGTIRSINYKTGYHNWSIKLDLNLHSAVVIDSDRNRLFVGTEWDKREPWYGRGDIVCLELSSGREIWRTPTRGMIPATPSYSKKHNIVLCGSNDFFVYILNADNGDIISKVPTRGEVKGKIAVSCDEEIFVAQTIQANVVAFDKSGTVIWKRNVGSDSIHPYPLIWDDCVYVTNSAGHILCLNLQDGEIKWVCRLRGAIGWGVIKLGNYLMALTKTGYLAIVDRFTGKKLAKDNITRTANITGVQTYQPPAYDGKNLVIVTNNKGILTYKLDINEFKFN